MVKRPKEICVENAKRTQDKGEGTGFVWWTLFPVQFLSKFLFQIIFDLASGQDNGKSKKRGLEGTKKVPAVAGPLKRVAKGTSGGKSYAFLETIVEEVCKSFVFLKVHGFRYFGNWVKVFIIL